MEKRESITKFGGEFMQLKKYFPIFVLPTLAAFLIAFVIPFVLGITLSFTEFTTIIYAQ